MSGIRRKSKAARAYIERRLYALLEEARDFGVQIEVVSYKKGNPVRAEQITIDSLNRDSPLVVVNIDHDA